MKKRKICIFTSTRADYGLLKPLIEEILNDEELKLQLIVSGMHLSPEFGLTYREIEKDGFKIDEKVEILMASDTKQGTLKSMGVALISFANSLEKLEPDICVVLGDRFEALAFALVCYTYTIPIAHIHGGELTYGAIDDGFRHAITKLAYLHFTSTESYRKRVIQMGESPERVFNVGALGIDNICNMRLLSKQEVEKKIGKKFKEKNLLITFHPETASKDSSVNQLRELLKVLEELDDTLFIFTNSNADAGGRAINSIIEEFVRTHPDNAVLLTSMGQQLYLSTMKYVDAVVGNSSSGIIEAPSFKIGTINIGDRQKGRIMAESVINCKGKYQEIKGAIDKLYSNEFKEILKNVKNPYGDGQAAKRIKEILKTYEIKTTKEFFDIPHRW